MTPVTIPPLDPVKQDAAVSLRVPAEPGGAVPGVRPPVEVSMKFRANCFTIFGETIPIMAFFLLKVTSMTGDLCYLPKPLKLKWTLDKPY